MPAITTEVRVPTGPIQKTAVLQAAITQVRNTLPPTRKLDADITDHRRDGDHAIFTDTITYERGTTAAKADALKDLPGVFGHIDDDTTDGDATAKALAALDNGDEKIKQAVRRNTRTTD